MRSIEDLLDSFARATEEGRLAWQTDGTEKYIAKLPRHRAVVWHWTDENDGTGGLTARLEGEDGKVLDTVSANEFSPKSVTLEKVFTAARRSAHNVGAVIDDVEKELASLKPVRT